MSKSVLATFDFNSKSSSRVYETLVYEDHSTSCNCPGWTFKRAGKARGCTHTINVARDMRNLIVEMAA
jgi:hypothetical protein